MKEGDVYRIKNHTSRNQYLHVGNDLWVRNPGNTGVQYLDLNSLTPIEDYSTILRNELVNSRLKYPWIDSENINCDMAVIVSDGHDFAEQHALIAALPPSVAIFAVNGALNKWRQTRNPNYYVVNNPYAEALHYLPQKAFPTCISSARTNHEFLQRYRGTKYSYYPVCDEKYCGTDAKGCVWRVDDYRNPVCAAINLLHRFGVRKLLLAFCDEVYDEERPGCLKSESGKFYYEQHLVANALIDGNLFWLAKNNKCVTAQATQGPKLKAATYIKVEEAMQFFLGK